MDFETIIKRSKRKTLSISISDKLQILIKAPNNMTDTQIKTLLLKHESWIKKQILRKKEYGINLEKNKLTAEKEKELKITAMKLISERVKYYSDIMGVAPAYVKITSAKTRWGSCSPGNGLCFSFKTALLPVDLIDYIVVHELSHIRIKNHGRVFYLEIKKYLPDYKKRVKDIKEVQIKKGL